MNKSLSFLLGAGFSAPMGYPVGKDLNKSLLKCTGENFSFNTDGLLCFSTDGKKPDFGFIPDYEFEFDFCRDLMLYFNDTKGYFDYEEFYDFFIYKAKEDPKVEKLFISKNYGSHKHLTDMLFSIKNIFNQLVINFLVDKEGNSWYDNAAYMGVPSFSGYTGILNCFHNFGKDYLVNVHTLNHDLFFERLNYTFGLQGELCDGFEELGSPYYGDLSVDKRSYKCRLEYYTGNYDKKYRLFKLHGSKDYGIYYASNGSTLMPENYIKTRRGISINKLFKEIEDSNKKLFYERCWINYHADFLTGTSSKIERYQEPLLFNILFDNFKKNLNESEKLIIIGYGGKDTEINKMLLSHFDFKNKPTFIIDPFAGDEIKNLNFKLGGSLIEKEIEDIEIEDLL